MTMADATRPAVGALLFTDLVGFTEYNDIVGDAEALSVLETQTALANRVVCDTPGARIVKELGDGLMIWFGSATDGFAGATQLLRLVEGARRRDEFPLAVRMGLHHGEALTRGDDLVGQTVNIAARVSALAGPGELLVSEAVIAMCDEVDEHARLQPVGPVNVKGVQEPIWLHRAAITV